MKTYIYRGLSDFIYHDACIAKFGDTIVVSKGGLRNITNNNTFTKIPDEILAEVLKDCATYSENVEEEDFLEPFVAIPSSNSNVDKFEAITSKMLDTFKRKNHDYGNSFEESLNEEGIAAARIRLGDKWNRFKTLSKHLSRMDAEVKDESIIDTLMDMSNYCIMTIMWLKDHNLGK